MPTRLPIDGKAAARLIPHRRYDQAQCVLFNGRRGQGKTTALVEYLETREPRVFVLDPFNDFTRIQKAKGIYDAMDAMAANPLACRRRVVPPIDEGSKEYAEWFFEVAIDELRNCLIVMDEMTLWSNSVASTPLTTLVLQGRRLGLRMAIACQRIALVPGVILSEMTELVVFNTQRPRDLDTLEMWTDKTTPEIARNLEVGQCLLISL